MGYGELDFSHCRKAPQGSVHYFSTVGGHAAAERLRARAFPIVSHRATVGSGSVQEGVVCGLAVGRKGMRERATPPSCTTPHV